MINPNVIVVGEHSVVQISLDLGNVEKARLLVDAISEVLPIPSEDPSPRDVGTMLAHILDLEPDDDPMRLDHIDALVHLLIDLQPQTENILREQADMDTVVITLLRSPTNWWNVTCHVVSTATFGRKLTDEELAHFIPKVVQEEFDPANYNESSTFHMYYNEAKKRQQ